jgi:uncharacterized lipoprotein YddW (UPF0748 family)
MKHKITKLLVIIFIGFALLKITDAKAQCVTGTEFTKTYPKRDLRGVFIASVVNIDWPKDKTAAPAVQQAELRTILDNVRSNGYNTVYLQVRPECDALYASTIEPWSYVLTGTQGLAPSPLWDPLQFAVTEAHSRGLDLHAWLNPYRAQRVSTEYTLASTHVVNTHPSWILTASNGTLKILDPGLPAVKDYIVSVIQDIASRYDVDGIHFDDYFYPMNGMTAAPNNQDKTTFANNNPGGLTLENWRRDNVNKMIAAVYDAIQIINTANNKNIIFGVSPFGIWKSGTPTGISGTSAFDALFCDPIAWLNSSKVDYLAPQLYWAITGSQDYIALSKWWNDQTKLKSKQLYVSQGYYKMDPNALAGVYPADDWPASEIQNQINQNRVANMDATFGQIAYSYTAIKNNLKGINGALNGAQFKYKSYAPPITGTGKDAICPTKPANIRFGTLKIQWDIPAAASDGDLPVKYVVYAFATAAEAITNKNDGSKIIDIVAGNEIALTQTQIDNNYFVVTSLDKNNNEAGDFSNTLNSNSITITWNGTTDTSWTNASNWSTGVLPTSTDNVAISGTNQPIIASNESIKSLTINAGKNLKVNSGFNLTVANAIVNAGTLTIENNANLLQTATATNSGAGSTIVKRNSNALSRLDYTMWSSPVTGQNLLNFSPLTTTNRFYTYNSSTDKFTAISSPSTTNFSKGIGYLIRMPNDAVTAPATQIFNGVFTGTLNNGDVTLAVANAKYIGVGNPYPSTISANTFISTNAITEALYFWSKSNNATSTSYATYTVGGGGVANIGGGSTIVPNGTIQVGQGFIAKSTSTSIKFTNAMRIADNRNQILKTKSKERNRIWLNLYNETTPINQLLVGYISGATQDIDDTIDGRYINDSQTALTSLINNEEFVIQGRSLPFDATDVVPLAFKTTAAGNYTISLANVDGFFSNSQDIFLVDASNGTETNLKTSEYTFTAASGVDNTRFSLKYQKTLGVDSTSSDSNNFLIFKSNGVLQIKSGLTAIDNVKLYDVNGHLLFKKENVNANEISIESAKFGNQVLIVTISTIDKKIVNKKIVN